MLFPIISCPTVNTFAFSEEEESDIYWWIVEIREYIENNLGYDLNAQDGKINTIQSDMQTVKEQTNVNVLDKSAVGQINRVPEIIGRLTSVLWDVIITNICEQDPASSTYLDETSGTYIIPLTINPLNPFKDFDSVVDVFKIAAYSLVLIFFSVNLIEQSVKYEIFTMKGALRIFGRLLVSKVIIDLSTTICGKILGTIGAIIVKVLGADKFTAFDSFVPKVDLDPCGIKIVGNLIDAIVAVVLSSIILLVVGTVLVFSALVVIKLMLRAFELSMLVCTSPVFFACASSDVTKEYFKKFIVTFLEVACQTLFMCVALKIGMGAITNNYAATITSFDDLSTYMETQLPMVIIVIAMCVMMIKPPKVLTNLLKG